MRDFIEGMHRVGEAMSAAISAQVTKEAQARRERQTETEARAQPPPHERTDH
ncbi:hypothetical protein [Micavibrio aeruginosavorus]|uniref:Uncharacterized protein n=1 Tax=Micavibrio aeruginosavorus EPB TaxID=349215 RepID=M4VIR4_9BACT|nr:hypothetical protein [Micavibrio aeruginosavorus]AGH97936.1 hypothetical protein A11S_1122 [Micavibrio aeruginosavorus EPB]